MVTSVGVVEVYAVFARMSATRSSTVGPTTCSPGWIGFPVPAVESAPPEPLEPGIVLALRALPERQRQVVALRFLCDLSTEQTADALGIATGTVTAHVHRALETLRSSLADLEEEGSTHVDR